MKKVFRLSLILKDAKKRGHKFADDLEPGVVAIQDLEFDVTEDQYNSNLFKAHLYVDRTQEIIEEHIDVEIEEIDG